jgi:hypothetical protein
MLRVISVPESIASPLPVVMFTATVVLILPSAVDGGGGGGSMTVVDILPAKTDRPSAIVNTNAAQSCLTVFMLFSLKTFSYP